MRKIVLSTQFKRDFKRLKKRGYDLNKLEGFISKLAKDVDLPASARPHKLSGNYADFWECHIAPDWLLIYNFADEELQLRRTGTHADLFD